MRASWSSGQALYECESANAEMQPRWSGPNGKRCRSTVAIETEFFSALDLNDARIMDDDFDRSVTKPFKSGDDVRDALIIEVGFGDGGKGLARHCWSPSSNLDYSDEVIK